MARIIISNTLKKQVLKKFKKESKKVFKLMESLEQNHQKGKVIGVAQSLTIKELKYKSFRFYFVVSGFNLKYLSKEEIENLLIKFVRMSDKNTQQKTINEIKNILQILGPSGFN